MQVIETSTKPLIRFEDRQIPNADAPIHLHKFLFPVEQNIVMTTGYLSYLAKAWGNHYAVVLAPHDIWYIIISELTLAVAKSPKEFAHLFTNEPEKKQLILVPTDRVDSIDPNLVIQLLKYYVPTDVKLFLPKFSTSTPMINMAMNVGFCDMVSPYYNYGTFMCGIPRVHVAGTQKDWELIADNLGELSPLFGGSLNKYLLRCQHNVNEIISTAFCDNPLRESYFEKMVKVDRCGSGSDKEMGGWIVQYLNRKDPTRPLQLQGLHPHTSKMKYENKESGRKFELSAGIFYSKFEDDILHPIYNAFQVETTGQIDPKTGKPEPSYFRKSETKISDIPRVSYPDDEEDEDEDETEVDQVHGPVEPTRGLIYAPYIPAEMTKKKTCKCGFDLSKPAFKGWTHGLCPNCAYAAVKG